MTAVPPQIAALARRARRVVALTGAGMSADSGISTFRDPETGLWARYDPQKIATPEAWRADPALVWAWYRWRSSQMHQVEPHAGHRALVQWDERAGVGVRVVTQNIDDLHERAGSDGTVHLHGSITALRCGDCGAPAEDTTPLLAEPVERLTPPSCAVCGGYVRPGIVWFGEELPHGAFEVADAAVRDADLVLVIGTSGAVYPAAALPHLALESGIPVVEIGPEPTDFSDYADEVWREGAVTALPALLASLR